MDVLNHLCILWAREQSHCKTLWQHAKIKSECIGKERTFLGAVREGGGVTLNYKSIKRHLSPWPGQICKVYLWTSVIYVNFLQNSLENIFGNNTVYWNLSVLALYSFVEKVFQSPVLWRWKSHKVREYSLSQLGLCMELVMSGGLASVLFDTFPVTVHY